MRSAILLDRDGTIIVDKGYLSDPDGVVLERGAVYGLRRLHDAGFILVGVTNQSGVGRGYFPLSAAEAVNARTATLLADEGITIASWYICPHAPGDDCDCRKPQPGLALQAARDLNLDLSRSWVIGDKPADVKLAAAVGAKGVLVRTGEGEGHRGWAVENGCPDVANLEEAAALILEGTPDSAKSR